MLREYLRGGFDLVVNFRSTFIVRIESNLIMKKCFMLYGGKVAGGESIMSKGFVMGG